MKNLNLRRRPRIRQAGDRQEDPQREGRLEGDYRQAHLEEARQLDRLGAEVHRVVRLHQQAEAQLYL